MGADDDHGLEPGIGGGGAEEAHAAAAEVAGEGVGERRGGAQGVGLAHHFVVGKAPGIGGKAALLRLNLQEDARVANGRLYLATVADDAGVLQQGGYLSLAKGGNGVRVEAGKGGTESLALVEHAFPRKPGHKHLQQQHLVEVSVIPQGAPPLFIVILHIERIAQIHPLAAADRHNRMSIFSMHHARMQAK